MRGRLTVYRPDGAPLAGVGLGDPLDLVNLTDTGVYTVSVDASSEVTIDLQVMADRAGEIEIDGEPVLLKLPPWQHGRYTFRGTVGQALGLGFGALGADPTRVAASFRVYKPDGTLLLRDEWRGPAYRAVLPTTGTYTLMVDPIDRKMTLVAVTLSSEDAGGVLAVSAPALRFNSARLGRNASYTFSGNAGESFSVVTTENTFAGGELIVYRPNGKVLSTNDFYAAVQPVNLPETGTYTVFVRPMPTGVGSVNVGLVSNLSGTMQIDATPVTLSLTTGQYARLTFSGAAGQKVRLSYSGVNTQPKDAIVVYRIINPDGSILFINSHHGNQGNDQVSLPTTGTYTLMVGPRHMASTNLTVMLSPVPGGPRVAD